MRVLVVSGMYPRGGSGASFIRRQLEEVKRCGVDVRVLSPTPRLLPEAAWPERLRALLRPTEEIWTDDIPVLHAPYLNSPRRWSPALLGWRLERALLLHCSHIRKSYPFDLIHANHLFPVGYATHRVADRLGTPVLLGARGSDVHTHPRTNAEVRRLTRNALRGAAVYAVSGGLARQVARLEPRVGSVPVVYNGVDTELFRPSEQRQRARSSLGIPGDATVFCTVARLVREKGLLELLHAVASLAAAAPAIRLVIVGAGPLRETMARAAAELGIADRLLLAGERPHGELPVWLNAADVFVLPSYNEGLPNVVLEAMACGLPVIATRVGGVPEAVVDGRTGILVAARNIDELAAAIRTLASSPSRRAKYGQNGLHRIRRHFGWRQSAMRLISEYEAAIDRFGRRRGPARRAGVAAAAAQAT